MEQYLNLLKHIKAHGSQKGDRTGTGTLSVFGYQMRFDLNKGFPLLTTKKVYTKAIIHELLWFLKGSTNIQYLVQNGVRIWNEWPFQKFLKKLNLEEKYPKHSEEWKEQMKKFVEEIKTNDEFAEKWGNLGPVYGKQWRDFDGIDQIKELIENLKNNPNSRRHIIVAWNPPQIKDMSLPACHCLFQFFVNENKLSCQLYQRSADVFLGVPFNIASYALLTMMIAQVTNLEVGEFIWTGGDTHLYNNHMDQVNEQLSREPKTLPVMNLNPGIKNIFEFNYEDFNLENYEPLPRIKAPVAI